MEPILTLMQVIWETWKSKSDSWKWIKLADFTLQRTATKIKNEIEHCEAEDAEIMASDGYSPPFNLITAVVFLFELGAASYGRWNGVGAQRFQFRSRHFFIWLHIGRLLRAMVRPLQASFSRGTFFQIIHRFSTLNSMFFRYHLISLRMATASPEM